jgi:hypothetical protein
MCSAKIQHDQMGLVCPLPAETAIDQALFVFACWMVRAHVWAGRCHGASIVRNLVLPGYQLCIQGYEEGKLLWKRFLFEGQMRKSQTNGLLAR